MPLAPLPVCAQFAPVGAITSRWQSHAERALCHCAKLELELELELEFQHCGGDPEAGRRMGARLAGAFGVQSWRRQVAGQEFVVLSLLLLQRRRRRRLVGGGQMFPVGVRACEVTCQRAGNN